MPTAKQLDSLKSISYEKAPRLPLWAILIIPFIIIIVVVVSSMNYLSYQTSQTVVDNIASQLMSEINTRIEFHLKTFLEIPQNINRTNANVFKHHTIDISDMDVIGRYFWEEVQFYETISSMYFGNPEGGLVSSGREGTDGSLYIITSNNFEDGPINKYATDSSANFTDLLVRVPYFDSRIRPWYIGAVEKADANWTAPYVLSTQQDLAIASSLPVYDDTGDLLGVVSVDLFISQINDFLQGIEIAKTGQTYIVEYSGLLIATSSGTPTVKEGDETWQRIHALDSENPTIAASAEYIINEFGDFSDIDSSLQACIDINGKAHYLSLTPFHRIAGLDWLILTTIPKEDFLGAIAAHNRVTFLLTIVAIIIAALIGTVAAIHISRPITRLSAAATQLAQGNWSQTVPIKGVEEVRSLGLAFNMMSSQLSELFNNLEVRVQERTAALTRSEARYRGIVEDQTELICRFSHDYKLTFVNDAYCRYYGKTREELVGISFMPWLPEEDQLYLEQELAKLSPAYPTIKVEHRVVFSDDQIPWMQWVNRALYDESGQFTEFQSVGRDMTDSKQHEDALQKALAKEMELNELKSHFISTVSHEFRTPMAIILNSSEIIERYSERLSQEKKTEHFSRIQTQIQRMTCLLEDVFTVHQAETGKLQSNPEKLNIVALCQSVIYDFQTTTDISFDFKFTEDYKIALTDEKLVRLIINNLVSNAAKYSPSNARVEVILNCSPEQVQLSVKDEGMGIPKEVQAQIFVPFFRANNADTIMGTGLGLTIVKKCVERLQGEISFESAVGKGTTFTIQLPNIDFEKESDENNSHD